MAKKMNLPANPTYRATLVSGEQVDYYGPPYGSHPTHWTFGGVDSEGNKDGSPVRTVPVASISELKAHPDAPPPADDEDDD